MPVYFIRAGKDGPVKIGWSKNVNSRISSIQTSNHGDIVLLRSIECDKIGESIFHYFFCDNRIRGEWFEYDERMLDITLEIAAIEVIKILLKKDNNSINKEYSTEEHIMSKCVSLSETSSHDEIVTVIDIIVTCESLQIDGINVFHELIRRTGMRRLALADLMHKRRATLEPLIRKSNVI